MELTHVCLGCRTLLRPRESCDACLGLAEVVGIRTTEGRAALRKAAWTQPGGEAAKGSGPFGAAFGVFSVLLLAAICAGAIWAVKADQKPLFFAIIFGGPVLWTVVLLVRALVPSRSLRGAVPAASKPEARPGLERRRGTVRAGADGVPAAEALTLDLGEGRGVTLRAGWSERGFEVELDDGRRLRVPAGRLRLEDPGAPRSRRMPRRWAEWFAASGIDPHWIFPHARAPAVALAGGARVEVIAATDVDRAVSRGGYRDEAEVLLVTRGLPWVRVLEPEGCAATAARPDAGRMAVAAPLAPPEGAEARADRGGSIFMGLLVTFIVLLLLSGGLGYGLTWLPELTEASWRGWALARVVWSLGSSVAIAATIAIPLLLPEKRRAGTAAAKPGAEAAGSGEEPEPPPTLGRRVVLSAKYFLLVAVFTVPIGALFCLAPLTDLVRGPVEDEVTAVRVHVSRGTAHRTVSYRLEVDLASGETLRSGGCLSAPHAPTWHRMASRCEGSGAPMHVRFLRAMMAPLEVECPDRRPDAL